MEWRLFKTVYFITGSFLGGLSYSLLNSWYYTNCPEIKINPSQLEEFCLKFFAWEELFVCIFLSFIILRIIFPFVEKITLYIFYNSHK